MGYYPIFLEMSGRRCLVVGGGNVAAGKVRGLLGADAEITVVSPNLDTELQALLRDGRIRHISRSYREGDVEGFELVMIATDDGVANAAVARHARARHIWVNAADDPPNCDFILPSVIRQGDVVVASSTGGASPALARRLREELELYLTDDFTPLAELLAEVRRELKSRHVSIAAQDWQRAIDGQLRVLLAQRRHGQAKARLLRSLGVFVEPRERASAGEQTLVAAKARG